MQHMEEFASCKTSVNWHIPSTYNTEMGRKSKIVSNHALTFTPLYVCYISTMQVPLGVQFHNENITHEMCLIMKDLHKYVPEERFKLSYRLPDENFICEEECYHRTLFGGDQLTACRCRGAQSARINDDDTAERLIGLVPVVEDWHARLTLMRVIISKCIYKHFYV